MVDDPVEKEPLDQVLYELDKAQSLCKEFKLVQAERLIKRLTDQIWNERHHLKPEVDNNEEEVKWQSTK